MNEERLSDLQVYILAFLLLNDTRDPWGVPWRPTRWFGPMTGSERAVWSRAVVRLERREFVLRQNERCWTDHDLPYAPGNGEVRRQAADRMCRRTTGLVLLPAGREIAERLTNGRSSFVSQSEDKR